MALRFTDQARIALGVADFATGFVAPSLRLGVTGLSRSGKTVFITALVHALMHGGRMPLFNAYANGRIARAYLEPQVHYELPRFAYEDHLAALTARERRWPESTSRMSELRLTIDYVPRGFFARSLSRGRLHIDILDYPGEWLLDLPLLSLTYREWSRATLEAAAQPPRATLAKAWLGHLAGIDPQAPADEMTAQTAAKLFTAYLARCRDDAVALSSLPPGRFLMPGDLAGSPLLTFAPLEIDGDAVAKGSLAEMMQRRYDAYVAHVVRPFFLDHFARLDRQIVLIDVLSALNAGPSAIADLKAALTDVLGAFRQGANTWLSQVLGRRIDRILFAATKADLVHHTSHAALAGILRAVIEDAATRAQYAGADIDVAAIAAVRATREATVSQGGHDLPCIVGVPQAGEAIGTQVFDGKAEAAVFPGDLPDDPAQALDGSLEGALRFVRFRPPVIAAPRPLMPAAPFPHIRLDRTLEFLIGDRLA
jgi:predicted YcjX-like family ATPase